MLSLRELRRAVQILDGLLPGSVLKRIAPVDASSLVLVFADSGKKKTEILLSCDPEYARLSSVGKPVAAVTSRASFYEYIRAHLPGAVLSGIGRSGSSSNPVRNPGYCTFPSCGPEATFISWTAGSG